MIEDVGMAVRESASFNILARDAHVKAVIDQSGKGQGFSSTPIDGVTFLNGLESLLEDFLDQSVEVAGCWQSRNAHADFLKF